jgi:hypothetical protein
VGAAVCAISLAVIVATNLLPGYQRDDWRGVAEALPEHAPYGRVLVVERYGGSPLSVYLASLHVPGTSQVKVREIAFAHLRTRHTSGAPYAPYVQLQGPRGFRLASVDKNEAFAVSRFVATGEPAVPVSRLVRLSGSPTSEVLLVR